jgi:hypothetical protein
MVSWAAPVRVRAQLPLLRVSKAGVCRWLPTIAVAVALMVTFVGPPKICMKARGSPCVVDS